MFKPILKSEKQNPKPKGQKRRKMNKGVVNPGRSQYGKRGGFGERKNSSEERGG